MVDDVGFIHVMTDMFPSPSPGVPSVSILFLPGGYHYTMQWLYAPTASAAHGQHNEYLGAALG